VVEEVTVDVLLVEGSIFCILEGVTVSDTILDGDTVTDVSVTIKVGGTPLQ